jgi:hypothetical protein
MSLALYYPPLLPYHPRIMSTDLCTLYLSLDSALSDTLTEPLDVLFLTSQEFLRHSFFLKTLCCPRYNDLDSMNHPIGKVSTLLLIPVDWVSRLVLRFPSKMHAIHRRRALSITHTSLQ